MAIQESQLETWSHQGAVITAKATADSIKNTINSYDDWPENIRFDVYLQGSYKNNTNIRGDMDVDIVAQLETTFCSNLTEEQKRSLGITPASYRLDDFRNDVLRALKEHYGASNITEGNKAIKIEDGNNRLPADVVVCIAYRKYYRIENGACVEGITFWTQNEGRQITNYPKQHYGNGVDKNQNTNRWYKPSIRMFKNIRGCIQGDSTPSYFLECLLYNVPDSKFGSSYQETFCNVVNWLDSAELEDFICQNEQLKLFGNTPEQWDINQAQAFINNLISLWNN